MERTHPLPPPGAEPSTAYNALAAVPASAAHTLLGLRVLMGQESRIPLDVPWIAQQLFPGLPEAWATDRVERDVLTLEDAGHASTWVQHGREWLALPPHGAAPHPPAQPPPARSPGPVFRDPFSSAWEREKEKENARARARAHALAEDQEIAAQWEAEYSTPGPRSRPSRPARLQAPPLGCPDHPNGTVTEECGPCGTAAERRKTFLARFRYDERLEMFEESQGEVWVPDEELF